jgi:flagellar hook protein FlgE
MGFATALSGLKAASTSLQVTGNNIANSQTTGFKESRAEFADVYASSIGGVAKTQPGAGVRVTEVAQQFNQGNIESTQNSLDLAVSGNGFFVMADKVNLPDKANPNAAVDPSVPTQYTRNGAFQLDNKGNVVNSQGKYLLAFAPNGATAAAGFSVGVFRPLTIDTAQGLPNATTNIALKLNINGAASAPTATVFDPKNPLSYNNTTSITTYDTQGNAHIASTYYVKTPVANVWDAYLFLDGYGITTGGQAAPPAVTPKSTVSSALNAPGAPIPMTFTAAGLLSDVGTRAASIISAAIVTAANTTVTDATAASGTAGLVGNVYTTTATAVTSAIAVVTDTAATKSAADAAVVLLGADSAANTAVQTAADLAVTSSAQLVTDAGLAAAANITPANAALVNAAVTAANKAALSATAAQTAAATLVSTALSSDAVLAQTAAVTAAADALAAQAAVNAYNAVSGPGATQTALAKAVSASAAATAFAASAASVNSTPGASVQAGLAKSTAATAAASAADYATKAGLVVDFTTAATAATAAAQAVIDAGLAQAAAVNFNTAVAAISAGSAQVTKVDFGNIDLKGINPNISVAPMSFNVDFFGTTQFATPFSVNGLNQDGLPAGNLTGIDVDGTGVVFARYSNGGSKALGQVALARFQNNQALAKLGDTMWATTSNSGQPIYGAAGDNNFGAIQSSALEGSNVDLSSQLVKLIIAQQAYQANSQTITTEKTLLETILRA